MGEMIQVTGTQNPGQAAQWQFRREGAAPGVTLDTEGNVTITGTLTVNGVPITGGGGIKLTSAYIKTGDVTLPNVGATWTPVTGFEIDAPAAVGDYVELAAGFLFKPQTNFLDLGVLVGASVVRYASSGTGTPAAAGEGDPSMYIQPGTFRTISELGFGFTVTSGDLDTGHVRFVLLTKGTGDAATSVFASTNYPFRWRVLNYGPPLP